MKLKATTTINLGVYMDIRPEIEIEVPDELKGPELVKWLHKEYFGLLDGWKADAPVNKKELPERTMYAKDKLFCKSCKSQVGPCKANGCDNCSFCQTTPDTEWPSGKWNGEDK